MQKLTSILTEEERHAIAQTTLTGKLIGVNFMALAEKIEQAVLAKIDAQAKEPVAWRVWCNATQTWSLRDRPVNGLLCEPLYASPPRTESEEVSEKERALEEVLNVLNDPVQLHRNMLSGAVAKITMAQCAHSHGEDMLARWHAFEAWELNQAKITQTDPYSTSCSKGCCVSNKDKSEAQTNAVTLLSLDAIKRLALQAGFTLKNAGDLRPYVYAFAHMVSVETMRQQKAD